MPTKILKRAVDVAIVCLIAYAFGGLFAACAPKPVMCQQSPQWLMNDAQGKPAKAIYVCFKKNGDLTSKERALSFDEIAKLVGLERPKPAPVAVPAAPPVVPHAPSAHVKPEPPAAAK